MPRQNSIVECANGCGFFTTKTCPRCGAKKPRKQASPKPRKESPLERKFIEKWALTGLPMPVAEYRFHPTRQWRFDFAFPDEKLAIELEGAVFTRGRHTRGSGYIKDLEKYNAATELGWYLLRYAKVTDEAILQVMRVYERLHEF